MKAHARPVLRVRNAQRAIIVSAAELERFGNVALALAWKQKRPNSEIGSVDVLSVLIISDRRMAELHAKFCGVSGSTDVLTFRHGEIAISAETANRQAHALQSSTERELRLYLAHGLLHLCGFDDSTAHARKKMQRAQTALLHAAMRESRMKPSRSV